jgi:hypothetical protein
MFAELNNHQFMVLFRELPDYVNRSISTQKRPMAEDSTIYRHLISTTTVMSLH